MNDGCPLFSRDELVPLKEAAARVGRTPDTVRRWVHRYGIGRQVGPNYPLEVSVLGLEIVLHGDQAALTAFQHGDRSHPRIRRYLDFLGLAA